MTARIVRPDAPDADAVAAFEAARGTAPFGPFVPLLHVPALLARVEALGRAVRYDGQLPNPVREVAIMTTAHVWAQAVEWAIHAPVALAAGVAPATLDAIAADAEPDAPHEQWLAWRVAHTLHRTRDLDDATFTDAQAALGIDGLLELTVVVGYYAMLAMVMNTARTAH